MKRIWQVFSAPFRRSFRECVHAPPVALVRPSLIRALIAARVRVSHTGQRQGWGAFWWYLWHTDMQRMCRVGNVYSPECCQTRSRVRT